MNQLITVLKQQKNVKVIAPEIGYTAYCDINLSAPTTDLLNLDLTNSQLFEIFIENHLQSNGAKIAFGGYLEKRNLYKRSIVFKDANIEERDIHIGLDLWIKAGTNVLAALDGTIHSFQNNDALGDYGPTVIIQHIINDCVFYTLYGHLSLESLSDKKIGQTVNKGEVIAQLGASPINGDYAPHLHFQIIADLEGKKGDYPGVCAEKDLAFYKNNCPDPNFLLQIV